MTHITLKELLDTFNTTFKNYDVVLECTLECGAVTSTGVVLSRSREQFSAVMEMLYEGWVTSIDPAYKNKFPMPHADDLTMAFFYEPDSDCPNGLLCLNIGNVNPFKKYIAWVNL